MQCKAETQAMAELPEQRLAPHTPPFHFTACDYFGPYQVKIGRNKTTKHYGVIFTCLNTRAVHVEMAVDCSTMDFLQVLRRFLAIHGYPKRIEVANLVNQRPIGRVPNDPDDGAYICPNDMLLGRASPQVPQGPFKETKDPRKRVEFVQKIVNSFWRQWTRDVFPSLFPRKKWDMTTRNVRVDDVVMMAGDNAIRGKWTIGRVTKFYPGKNKRVRNVTILTSGKEYNRPITKIAVIDPSEGLEEELSLGGSVSLHPQNCIYNIKTFIVNKY